ncbi:MAG: hypothetical protein MK179_12760, partial [Pirellulaceae bacterium]|nr:hypothetical protein [Pirellulaceae bacterium]
VATVTGADSQWNISGHLHVEYLGTGSLNVESAGVVNSGVSVIGLNSGSIGVATITGAGSQWNNTAIPVHVGSSTLTVGHLPSQNHQRCS